MHHINPVNYLGFALLGGALLWAVRLVYGVRPGDTDDVMRRVLLLAGWVLLLGGVLGTGVALTGPFSFLMIFGIVAIGFGYFKYMEAERRALLWALAVAAEKGIPLEQAARAFADERAVQIGLRVTRLAGHLEGGVPLPDAMVLSRNPLPADALLAARLGAETGHMGSALRMCLEHDDHRDGALRSVAARYLYVLAVLGVGMNVVIFIMLKIVPVWTKMFEEFELELPALTRLLIASSDFALTAWPIVVLSYVLIFFLILLGVSYYLRWSRYDLPLFSRLWIRCDGSLVLRALALAVRQKRGLGPTIAMLARQYPRPSVAKRLGRASAHVDGGAHWCDALRWTGLIRPCDVAVLKAGELADNLAWALEEMADSMLRRSVYWMKAEAAVVFPGVVLVAGVFVLFVVVGLFLPLISMIQGLT